MSPKFTAMNEKLHRYTVEHSLREPPLLKRLREETMSLPGARMLTAPEQGQFMALLAQVLGTRKYLEVGTFTGYSALWIALHMPASGRIDTCDIDESATAIARRYWEEAGVAARIGLHLGPALQTLDHLIETDQQSSFDLAFIDADKENYDVYYEVVLKLIRPGGLIMVDNVFWGGAVTDLRRKDAETQAIRGLNAKIKDDSRVDCSLVPIGDGLMLARKRH